MILDRRTDSNMRNDLYKMMCEIVDRYTTATADDTLTRGESSAFRWLVEYADSMIRRLHKEKGYHRKFLRIGIANLITRHHGQWITKTIPLRVEPSFLDRMRASART